MDIKLAINYFISFEQKKMLRYDLRDKASPNISTQEQKCNLTSDVYKICRMRFSVFIITKEKF